MINAKFSSNMINLLKNIIGQKFLSYERAKDGISDSTYGNIRLRFSNSTVDLSNKQEFCFEFNEDIATFSCILVDDNLPFKPMMVSDTETITIDGIVKDIEIISDEICLNNGEMILEFDSAIIFQTDSGNYMFAKTEWFSEIILIAHNTSYDKIFSLKKVKESWENEGENLVKVTRFRTNISNLP